MLARIMCCIVLVVPLLAEAAPARADSFAPGRRLDVEAARRQILDGVTEIHGGVQPGRMVCYGPRSAAIAAYPGGRREGTVVGVATWGRGRVVALPDHQMLQMDAYADQGDGGRFYLNAIDWLTPGRTAAETRILVTSHTSAARWLSDQGFAEVRQVPRSEQDYARMLEGCDVLVGWLGANVSPAGLRAISGFVEDGGGLLICEYGAGYRMWWKKPFHEAPANVLLRRVGIGFPRGNRFDKDLVAIEPTSTPLSSHELVRLLRGRQHVPPEVDAAAAGRLLSALYDVLAPDDPLIAKLDAAYRRRVATVHPTPASPVDDPLEKALLRRELAALSVVPAGDVRAHRTAEAVFGAIPDDAPRVTRTLRIDPARTRWHSTGLYAAPGEAVHVRVPEAWTGAGLRIRISGHTDDIAKRRRWRRMPRVARSYDVTATELVVAGAFGGAIYVDVGAEPRSVPAFDVAFSGAVEAPMFVLGETTDEQWVGGLRDLPAPYAELVSEHLVLALPSSAIRALDDPTALMTFWDRTVAFQDELAGHAHVRTNPERINIDVQVSAGAAHAGYPAQGPSIWGMTDLALLTRTGSWGWFHELGHESQRRPDKAWGWNNPYTFDGAVEATVNIFSTYTRDRHGITDPEGWGWTSDPTRVAERAREAIDAGGFAAVGVGLKLAMYLQLRDAFGWDAWKRALRSYNRDFDADPSSMPRETQARRDAFLVRMSGACGHDLTPFLRDLWKIPLSDEAIDRVSHLPTWMPENFGSGASR